MLVCLLFRHPADSLLRIFLPNIYIYIMSFLLICLWSPSKYLTVGEAFNILYSLFPGGTAVGLLLSIRDIADVPLACVINFHLTFLSYVVKPFLPHNAIFSHHPCSEGCQSFMPRKFKGFVLARA